jgi:hypothetical protein
MNCRPTGSGGQRRSGRGQMRRLPSGATCPSLPALLAGTRTSVAGRSTTLSTTRLLRVRAKTRTAEQLPRHGTGCIRPFLEPLPFGDEVIRSGGRGIVTGSEFQWLRARQDAK